MRNKGDQNNFQDAKAAAQRLFKKVNYQGGNLQTYQISSLMQETYDFLKIPFKPTNNDIKQYEKVLDANGDGFVSLSDLETMAVNYLCGDTIVSQSRPTKKVGFSQYDYNVNSRINSTQKTENLNTQKYGAQFGGNQYGKSQENKGLYYQNTLKKQSYQQAQSSRYNQTALNYLNITRNLFKKYANRQTNTITRDRVANLLTETYSALGRNGYYPNQQDVNVWMKLCDTNQDGHVQDSEYQYFVIRSLERSGIKVNNG